MARKTNYSKNGNDYYRITASVGRDSNGKLIRKEFYGKSKTEAKDKRDEYLNGIKQGLNINYKDAILGETMHSWLFDIVRVKVKPSSFEKYEGIYRNYILNSEIYGLRVCDTKTIQIQRYYNKLYESGKSSSVIANLNKLMRAFFNFAINEGYILKNPCSKKKITIPKDKDKIEDKKVEIFSDEEIQVLKKALEGNKLKCLILMALGTGMRQGELLALKWDDIDFDNCEVRVNKSIKNVKLISADGTSKRKIIEQPPKTQASNRIVPFPSNLIHILEEYKPLQEKQKKAAGSSYNDSKLVFATEIGNPIIATNLLRNYSSLLKKAGIKYKKFHALRHTYATKLFEKGVPLKTVSELLGHSNISVTANIYTHVMPKDKISAVEKLNDLFD